MDEISTLKTKTISELRVIAKTIGVKSPTIMKKDELIAEIERVVSQPKEEREKSNEPKRRGRPRKSEKSELQPKSSDNQQESSDNQSESNDGNSTTVENKSNQTDEATNEEPKLIRRRERIPYKQRVATSRPNNFETQVPVTPEKVEEKTEESVSVEVKPTTEEKEERVDRAVMTPREKWLMRQAQQKARIAERNGKRRDPLAKNESAENAERAESVEVQVSEEVEEEESPIENAKRVVEEVSNDITNNNSGFKSRYNNNRQQANVPEFLAKIVSDGVLEVMPDGYGFLRSSDYNYLNSPDDIYVSIGHIKSHGLKLGDTIKGEIRPPRDGERYFALTKIISVNGLAPDFVRDRVQFEFLTPLFPQEKFNITGGRHNSISNRIIDMFSPIGKGQRALIVAPPKTGKTTLLKDLANAIAANHPEVYMIVLLIDERPEEVTDMQRSVNAEVISSTFDEQAQRHVKVAEMVLEKAKRMVECGHDVVIVLDSITRLARAYNTVQPPSGKVLSGGVDANALHRPKRFLGAARNTEEKGSLTIIASALIETGSKMDEVIFEEFKGTGNMELQLDRKLSNKRLYPAVDLTSSSTRREDLLMPRNIVQKTWIVRRHIAEMTSIEALELIRKQMENTRTNEQLLEELDQ